MIGWIPFFSVFALLCCTQWAHAAEVRNYGMYLEDKYFLRVEEDAGIVTIILREESRATGGPSLFVDPETNDDPVIRYKAEHPLVRLAAEVILPSAPNYLKNPGQTYRITIEGIEVAPQYTRIFEVVAADALNAVRSEMSNFISRTEGIQKDALFYGTVLALRAFNEAQRLPAEIPLTVLRSDVGSFRIQGPGMQRREVESSERFTDVESSGGQGFNRVMKVEDELANPTREPGYRRGMPGNDLGRSQSSYYTRQTEPYRGIKPPNYRVEQVKGIQSSPSKYAKPGIAGRPLTVPETELPPITASQNMNREYLQGGTLSAADAIAGRVLK